MYTGLFVSLILHVGILAWAFVSIQSTSQLDLPDVATIEAEIITIDEFTRLKKGDPEAKKLEAKAKEKPEPQVSKKEAPKPKPEVAPPPPAEQMPPPPKETAEKDKPEPTPPVEPKSDPIADKLAALTPPPPPAPNVEEKKRLEEERKKKAKEEAKKKAAEKKRKAKEAAKRREREKKRKAKAKKKDFAKSMKALLDKTPEKRGAPRSSTEPENPTDYEGPTAGEREGQGTQLTAREEDLLKGQISAQLRSCWRLPGGGGGTHMPVVTLKWTLRPDGTLNSAPRVQGGSSDPAFRIATESAIRAVTQCAPFDLPPKYYTSWKTIIWDFDPRQML